MPHLIKVFIKIYPHIPIQQAHIQEYTIELMQAAMRLRLSEEKTQAVKREFSTVQNNGGIITPDNEWVSTRHVVKKKKRGGADINFRCCGDYRALNSITKSDKYSIPNVNSITDKLANKTRFSKIDMASAQHQIKMHPDDIKKQKKQHLLLLSDCTNT